MALVGWSRSSRRGIDDHALGVGGRVDLGVDGEAAARAGAWLRMAPDQVSFPWGQYEHEASSGSRMSPTASADELAREHQWDIQVGWLGLTPLAPTMTAVAILNGFHRPISRLAGPRARAAAYFWPVLAGTRS
jgi:hypothetical protein